LAELGLNQSARAQKFAMIPENIFRETIAETISKVRIVSPPFSSARRLQTGNQFFRPLFPRGGNAGRILTTGLRCSASRAQVRH
jgi:hypothetical protein